LRTIRRWLRSVAPSNRSSRRRPHYTPLVCQSLEQRFALTVAVNGLPESDALLDAVTPSVEAITVVNQAAEGMPDDAAQATSSEAMSPAWGALLAAPVPGKGTWETSLQPRSYEGRVVAYYDAVLNLTWLADANYAKTSGHDADGLMTTWDANAWVASLTLFGGGDWRLPTVRITDGLFVSNFSNCGGTDVGGGDWGTRSEMGYMYYSHLGNVGFYIADKRDPTVALGPNRGYGLKNTGLFVNLQPSLYWTHNETVASPGRSGAVSLSFATGVQDVTYVYATLGRAWPVHDGDLLGSEQPPLLGGTVTPSVEAVEVVGPAGKVVLSEAALARKTYAAGERLTFRVTFSEPVVVTGVPTLPLEIGSVACSATWTGRGNRTRALTFSLRIGTGDFDARGVRIAGPLGLADGASIRNAAGTDVDPTASGTFPGVKVDSVGPSVVRFDPAVVGPRGGVRLRVHFDGPVRVTGSPSVPFTINAVRRSLVFARRIGDNSLLFVSRPRGGERPSAVNVALPAAPRVRLPDGATITDRIGNRARSLATPTGIMLSPARVAENLVVGTPVGRFSSVDADGSRDGFTYALVPGDGDSGNTSFTIDGDRLKAAAVFDYEERQHHAIRVRVTDAGGLSTERSFLVAVTDLNEPPTDVGFADPVTRLSEKTSTAGRVRLADIVVGDDATGINTITLTGADAGSLECLDGVLYLRAGVTLDRRTKASYSVLVNAVDGTIPGTLPVAAEFTFEVVAEFAPDVRAGFQAALDATRTEHGFPGAIAGVWNPSGSWIGVTGVAGAGSDRPPGLSDHSRIGSVTKTFTAISLLQQVDKGLLSLDDPIEKYVPGMPNGTTATLRMLADMTSGIPSYSADFDFLTTYFSDTSTGFTATQLVDYARGQEPLFPAGTAFDYSNTNTVLLGMVIEQVAGRPIAEVFATEIFGPLGMTGASYPDASVSLPTPHLEGITLQPDGAGQPKDATHWNPSWTSTAGAMIARIDDLRIWGQVLGTGGGLISPELQQERLASVAGAPAGEDVYGLGFVSFGGWLGHNGKLPGYTAYVAYDPATETVVAVMANSDIGEIPPADAIAHALAALVTARS